MRIASASRAMSDSSAHLAPRASTSGRFAASASQASTVKPFFAMWPTNARPIRPVPMTPIVAGSASPGSCFSAEPGLLVGEDNTLLRVDANEDGAADRRTQRRMLTCEQRSRSRHDAEVNRVAEEHLLFHRGLQDVLT